MPGDDTSSEEDEDTGVFSRWGKKLASYFGKQKEAQQQAIEERSEQVKSTTEIEAATSQKRAWLDQQAVVVTADHLTTWPDKLIECFYVVGLPPDTEVTQIAYDLLGQERLAHQGDGLSSRTSGPVSSLSTAQAAHLQQAFSRSAPGTQPSTSGAAPTAPSVLHLPPATRSGEQLPQPFSAAAGGAAERSSPADGPPRSAQLVLGIPSVSHASPGYIGLSNVDSQCFSPSDACGGAGASEVFSPGGPMAVDGTLLPSNSQRQPPAYDRPQSPAYPPSVLFRYPSGTNPTISDQEVAELCFPNQVAPRRLRRSPSWSALYGVINHRASISLGTVYIFMVKSVNSLPLYGVCYAVEEPLHRPPSLAQGTWPACSAPYRQCLITAPRCYCITSHYPFFTLLCQALNLVLGLERMNRSLAFTLELHADRSNHHALMSPVGPSGTTTNTVQHSYALPGRQQTQQQTLQQQQQQTHQQQAQLAQQTQQQDTEQAQQAEQTQHIAEEEEEGVEEEEEGHIGQSAAALQGHQASAPALFQPDPGPSSSAVAPPDTHPYADPQEDPTTATPAPLQSQSSSAYPTGTPPLSGGGSVPRRPPQLTTAAPPRPRPSLDALGETPTPGSATSTPRGSDLTRHVSIASFHTAAEADCADADDVTGPLHAFADFPSPTQVGGGGRGSAAVSLSRLGSPRPISLSHGELREGSVEPQQAFSPEPSRLGLLSGSHGGTSHAISHGGASVYDDACQAISHGGASMYDGASHGGASGYDGASHGGAEAHGGGAEQGAPAATLPDAPSTPSAKPSALLQPPRACRSLLAATRQEIEGEEGTGESQPDTSASAHAAATLGMQQQSPPAAPAPPTAGQVPGLGQVQGRTTASSAPDRIGLAPAAALPLVQRRTTGGGSSVMGGSRLASVDGGVGHERGSAGDGNMRRSQELFPSPPPQFSPLSVLDALMAVDVPTPGDQLQVPLQGLPALSHNRWLLPRRWPVLAPAQALNAYAEDELAAELAPWATAILVRSLSLPALISLLSAALLERPIVFFHPDPSLLTCCVLGVLPMLRPFTWQCVVLPMMPSSTLSLLDAPVPFLVGCQYKTPEVLAKCTSLVRINLYKGSASNAASLPPLPGLKRLTACLAPHYDRLRASEAAMSGGRPTDKGLAAAHAVPDEQVQAAGAILWEVYVHLVGVPSVTVPPPAPSWTDIPDTDTTHTAQGANGPAAANGDVAGSAQARTAMRASEPGPTVAAASARGSDTGQEPSAAAQPLAPTQSTSAPGGVPSALDAAAAAKPRPAPNTAPPPLRSSATAPLPPRPLGPGGRPLWAGVVGELRPHMITYVGTDGARTATLLRESLLEVQAPRDRPWVKAFMDTQMFQVYTDQVMAAFCEGRRWD